MSVKWAIFGTIEHRSLYREISTKWAISGRIEHRSLYRERSAKWAISGTQPKLTCQYLPWLVECGFQNVPFLVQRYTSSFLLGWYQQTEPLQKMILRSVYCAQNVNRKTSLLKWYISPAYTRPLKQFGSQLKVSQLCVNVLNRFSNRLT